MTGFEWFGLIIWSTFITLIVGLVVAGVIDWINERRED